MFSKTTILAALALASAGAALADPSLVAPNLQASPGATTPLKVSINGDVQNLCGIMLTIDTSAVTPATAPGLTVAQPYSTEILAQAFAGSQTLFGHVVPADALGIPIPTRQRIGIVHSLPVDGPADVISLPLMIPPDAPPGARYTIQVSAVCNDPDGVKLPVAPATATLTVGALKGDVDGDGKVNVKDVLLALRAALGLITLTPEQASRADVNGDGKITIVDAQLILHAAVFGPSSPPAAQSVLKARGLGMQARTAGAPPGTRSRGGLSHALSSARAPRKDGARDAAILLPPRLASMALLLKMLALQPYPALAHIPLPTNPWAARGCLAQINDTTQSYAVFSSFQKFGQADCIDIKATQGDEVKMAIVIPTKLAYEGGGDIAVYLVGPGLPPATADVPGIVPDGSGAIRATIDPMLAPYPHFTFLGWWFGAQVDATFPQTGLYEARIISPTGWRGEYIFTTSGSDPITSDITKTQLPTPGDVTLDGQVNTDDANTAMTIALGVDLPQNELAFYAGDVAPPGDPTNGIIPGDGVIDLADVTRIYRRALGLDTNPHWPN